MTPPPQATSPARVDELDGLRGLLALWVALSHILAWTGHWENQFLPRRLAGAWEVFMGAKPAVDTFIILSGFAISFLLHKRRHSYLGFMRGRCFRIYPVYLFCLALGIATTFLTPFILQTATWNQTIYFRWVEALAANESSAFFSHIFWHLTLLNGVLTKDFLPGASGTLLTPAWSITLEWQYYLIAPFLARGVRSGGTLLAIGALALFGLHFGSHWANPQQSFMPAQLPLFLIGIGSYHLYAHLSKSTGFQHLPSVAAASLTLIALLGGWHPVALIAWAVGFGCILVRGTDPLARALGLTRAILLNRWLQHLGKISFPLYLVHWPVIIGILFLLLHLSPEIAPIKALAILLVTGLPAILISAEIIHRFIEKPTMAFGKKFDKRSREAKG